MTDTFDATLAEARLALDLIARGDASGYKKLFSRTADITLGNPFGGIGHGWDEVVETLDRAASYYADGRVARFDLVTKVVTPALAYTVMIEAIDTKVGGSDDMATVSVRVTCVYQREADGWKLVHRHADPRVARQAATSVLPT